MKMTQEKIIKTVATASKVLFIVATLAGNWVNDKNVEKMIDKKISEKFSEKEP